MFHFLNDLAAIRSDYQESVLLLRSAAPVHLDRSQMHEGYSYGRVYIVWLCWLIGCTSLLLSSCTEEKQSHYLSKFIQKQTAGSCRFIIGKHFHAVLLFFFYSGTWTTFVLSLLAELRFGTLIIKISWFMFLYHGCKFESKQIFFFFSLYRDSIHTFIGMIMTHEKEEQGLQELDLFLDLLNAVRFIKIKM